MESGNFIEFLPFLVGVDEEPELELDSGTKTEPSTPTACCQRSFEDLGQPGDGVIRVGFPDLKTVYLKTQSRANRLSRQRVENGKVKIRVVALGPQVQTIEVYVERDPDAAVLVGDKCGRVRLKAQPGKYFPNQVTEMLLVSMRSPYVTLRQASKLIFFFLGVMLLAPGIKILGAYWFEEGASENIITNINVRKYVYLCIPSIENFTLFIYLRCDFYKTFPLEKPLKILG